MSNAPRDEVAKTMSRKTNRPADFNFLVELEKYYQESEDNFPEKMAAFPKYVSRQRLTDFLSLYEVFKKVLHLPGSVVDCGVYKGRTLMTWAQCSVILEPMNYQRKIIGFDSFEGYLRIDPEDAKSTHEQNVVGGLAAPEAYEDLDRCISLFDANRFLNHMPKVVVVKGDIEKTAFEYLEENPSTVVSLLSLDLSLFGPTRAALKAFVPRMPKGAVITFGEMNCSDFTGEVAAVMEELGLRNLRLHRNPFDTVAAHAVLE